MGQLYLIDVNQQARASSSRKVADPLSISRRGHYGVVAVHGPMDSGTTSNGVPQGPCRCSHGRRRSSRSERSRERESVSPVATLFREHFEQFLPTIQQEWPEVARHTLEATRGGVDTVVEVIARQTGRTSDGVKDQLLDLLTLGRTRPSNGRIR